MTPPHSIRARGAGAIGSVIPAVIAMTCSAGHYGGKDPLLGLELGWGWLGTSIVEQHTAPGGRRAETSLCLDAAAMAFQRSSLSGGDNEEPMRISGLHRALAPL